MLRSLYSAVSGLNIHQTEMDVIGNNIANVNSNAYKSKATNFSDVLYQSKAGAAAATETRGSTNPIQVGLGGQVASIDVNIMAQGSALTTNGAFDMMITGSNFFIVSKGADQYYTRDGSFMVDSDGMLVNSSLGYYVQGWTSANGVDVDTDGAIGNLDLMADELQTSPGEATTVITVTGNVDKTDTQLTAGRGMTAAVYSAAGDSYNLKFDLTDAGDEDATTYTLTLTGVTDAEGKAIATDAQKIDLVYDAAKGKLTSANGNAAGTAVITLPAGAGGAAVTLDLSGTHNYNSSGTSSFSMKRGDEDGNNAGRLEGTMSGITVSKTGLITADYTNGAYRTIGQVATAAFMNATGLVSEGDNLYSASSASGEAQIEPVDENGGKISTGVLEASNVDLADEFTRMITAQRAFQANSRVITTSDTMLSELRQLKS